jgi:diamine N-acetyltransferase
MLYDFELIPAGPDQALLIERIGRATYEPYYPHIWYEGGMEWYMQRCFSQASLQQDFAEPNIRYFFPTSLGGDILGILKLGMQKTVPETQIHNALYLEKIYLMPAFFGKGYGQAIMQRVKDLALLLGREAVWLIVMEHGPVQVYEKAGFQRIGGVDFPFEQLLPEQRKGYVMVWQH